MSSAKGAELLAAAAGRMRADFEAIRSSIPHQGEKGREAQETLIRFLNKHLPHRFTSTSGFVVDTTGEVSRHLDVIVYDHLDALVFSPADDTVIIPNDNVGAVIEVKSTLNKRALEEAADQLAHAKRLSKAPHIDTDFPLQHSSLQLTHTRGTVFAYTSDTSLDALWNNLRDINASTDSDHWVDDVVVLDRGVIRYMAHFPYVTQQFYWGGNTPSLDVATPIYVVPTVWDAPNMALPAFVAMLSSHLAHYRRRPTLPLSFLLPDGAQGTTRHGYWYSTASKLTQVPDAAHTPSDGSPLHPAQRLTFLNGKNEPLGRVEWFPWADGHIFAFMIGAVPARELITSTLLMKYGVKIRMHSAAPGLELTQVLPGNVAPHMKHALLRLRSASMPFKLKVEDFGSATGSGGAP